MQNKIVNSNNATFNQSCCAIISPIKLISNIVGDCIYAWSHFLKDYIWQEIIKGHDEKHSECGKVYELPNFLNRYNEDFAIVDMRAIQYAEPHYHPDENIEIYFVLQGTALVVVGNEQYYVTPGNVVIIPPNVAHFTIPDNNFVIAVVNIPPFRAENYIPLAQSNETVNFDYDLFVRLIQNNKK